MKKIFLFMAFFAAMLLASCSKDEALLNENGENGGLTTAKISVTLPSGGMSARATASDDAAATRCLMQVLDAEGNPLGDNFSDVQSANVSGTTASFTVMLKAGEQYDFLFWADNTATEVTDLKNVSYENGTTIAFAGRLDNAQWSNAGLTAKLTHAVSRVTVHSTTAVTLTEKNDFTLEVPTVYTAYNVATGAVTGESSKYTYTNSAATATANSNLGYFYALVNGDNQALTMQYNGVLGNPEVTVGDVPLKSNCHTTLTGDVYHLGLTDGTITATISEDWTDGEKFFSDYLIDADGTYIVYTAKGLLAWAAYVNAGHWDTNCTLATDIDLTGIEWTPVGIYVGDKPYTGTFDGGNHTITGLTVSKGTTDDFAGLFSYVGEKGSVKNLDLKNVNIKGLSLTGGIAADNLGTIDHCSVSSGTVSTITSIVGGIAGANEKGIITSCHSTCNVNNESPVTFVGGIVGANLEGTVSSCHSSSNVSGRMDVGGIIGSNSGSVTACYFSGTVSGDDRTGGVIGKNESGNVTVCYFTGTVSGNEHVGGIIGVNREYSEVTACYSTGNISGKEQVGGIVGYNSESTVATCFWDNYDGSGIGLDEGIDESIKVNGTNVTWETAQDIMNAVLEYNEWQYVGASATTPPTLSKK